MRKICFVIISTALTFIFAASALAGEPSSYKASTSNMTRAAQYYVGEENELMMKVNIWGRVEKPGQYFVPTTTDLITLISLAGGPADKSRLDNVKVVRTGEGGSEVIEVNIKKFLKTGDIRLIPQLKPEDTILVSGSAWYLASQIIGMVAQLSIVANVYYWFFVRGL
ncbi:SLBB domain-containing protein [bacterium]|nr:SLBB domain-containing protein [FCB group bacterium]MBL7191316.1 SLBB domain-containing protein [bacterium]